MKNDLIFHITTKKGWKEYQKNGSYEPESLEQEGFIHCSKGSQLQEIANRLFSGKRKILLLVIDVSTLRSELKYDSDEQSGEQFPHIYGPLNIDAVIDKIPVHAEQDGHFEISFSSD